MVFLISSSASSANEMGESHINQGDLLQVTVAESISGNESVKGSDNLTTNLGLIQKFFSWYYSF